MFSVRVVNKKFNVFRSFEQNKNVIDTPFIEHWFKMIRTVIQAFSFMMT